MSGEWDEKELEQALISLRGLAERLRKARELLELWKEADGQKHLANEEPSEDK